MTPKELRTKRGLAGILKVRRGDGGAEARPDHDAEADQDGGGDECADGAEIVDPLADAEANDVENGEEGQQRERSGEREGFVIGESRDGWGP